MSAINCPRCSTRFIEGETNCEYCGYKTRSKLFKNKAVGKGSSSLNSAVEEFERAETELELQERREFRVKLGKYVLVLSTCIWLPLLLSLFL
jgi:DNA-directed RNA polymerase subunit RPC12/RpoP